MRLWLLRHATLRIRAGDVDILVDPQLDPAGARPPVPGTANPRLNPLVDLPEPPGVAVQHLGAVVVTHLHEDHLDSTAIELLPRDVPLLCQPPDAEPLAEHGFADVRPVEEAAALDGLTITRTDGRHGTGSIGERLGPVSGFVIAEGEAPPLYVAGDTIFYDGVAEALDRHHPAVVVVNAGGTRFIEGDPITMDADDVVATARHAPSVRVVAVHMEAMNHCPLTRADLRARLRDEGLAEQVTVPEDGAEVPLG
jgi:L-ascorbate metabolism protein UlaG (beta-lactamase superfamily)